jgi:hypothetical protein
MEIALNPQDVQQMRAFLVFAAIVTLLLIAYWFIDKDDDDDFDGYAY